MAKGLLRRLFAGSAKTPSKSVKAAASETAAPSDGAVVAIETAPDTPDVGHAKAELVRAAMAIHKGKQSALSDLDAAQRQQLEELAKSVFGIDAPSKNRRH